MDGTTFIDAYQQVENVTSVFRQHPRRWVAVALYALLMLVASSFPGSVVQGLELQLSDKLLHFVEYAGFGALLVWASGHGPIALALAASFGALDELHQAFIPGRFASGLDWVADVGGAVMGILMIVVLRKVFWSRVQG